MVARRALASGVHSIGRGYRLHHAPGERERRLHAKSGYRQNAQQDENAPQHPQRLAGLEPAVSIKGALKLS